MTGPLKRLRPDREVVLGPVRLRDGVFTMRSPRLRDAPAWSAARLANRDWLERAFPAWGDDWVAEQSEAAWIQRWWHLRRLRHRDGARPFVLLLDGELIGELGIDAVDAVTGGGEASVWMVRDHAASVMNVASLLMIRHAFGEPHPMDRLISPVATTSRKGRAPGLTAVGFQIEATVPRPIGRGGAVDHDIWILHNSAVVRANVDRTLAAMQGSSAPESPAPVRPGPAEVRVLTSAVARAAVRELKGAVRGARDRRTHRPAGAQQLRVGGADVEITPGGDVIRHGSRIGRLRTGSDLGTATATVRAWLEVPSGAEALAGAVAAVVGDVATWAPDARWAEVRLPASAVALSTDVPSADAVPGEIVGARLAALGFAHTATFRGNPDGPRRWPGEVCWSRPVD